MISLDLPELLKVYEKLRPTGIELYDTKEELRKANEKIISLEEQLKSVNETVEMSDAKYKEVSKNVQKLEEKITLMRHQYQMSCISLKIQNDDQKTRLFTGLSSYDVFAVLVTHLTPLATKEKSLGSGLSLADELLVTLLKMSQGVTN